MHTERAVVCVHGKHTFPFASGALHTLARHTRVRARARAGPACRGTSAADSKLCVSMPSCSA